MISVERCPVRNNGRISCNIREASNTDFDINQKYGQSIFTFEKFK